MRYLRLLPILICVALLGCRQTSHYDVDRSTYPVKGIDVSAHNGNIDFDAAKADSIDFAIIKATEGTDFCDALFEYNVRNAKAAGLKVSAYHFFRFDSPGHIQAYHFLTALRDVGVEMDMPVTIDVEEWKNAENVPDTEVVEQLQNMIAVVQNAGYPVMIYTNRKGYENYIRGNFEDIPLWISSLSSKPTVENWHIWQHSHVGSVKGINGPVDLNTLNIP